MFKCICKFCNSEFESKQPSTVICESCKNRPCEICGKTFVHVWPYDQKCCSKECRKILINDPKHQAKAIAKRDETVKMKYGVGNVSELSSVKNKISKSKTDKEAYFEEKQKEAEAAKKPLIRQCVICGQNFEAIGNQSICKRPHYRNCEYCGRPFEVNRTSNVRSTCSDSCWRNLSAKTLRLSNNDS